MLQNIALKYYSVVVDQSDYTITRASRGQTFVHSIDSTDYLRPGCSESVVGELHLGLTRGQR